VYAPDEGVGFDLVQQHLGVPAVGRIAESYPPGKRHDDKDLAGKKILSERLAD